jgi:quinohemoprotein ethanol dehydrogenase
MRRVALILAALFLVVGAAACGGGEDESATPETVEGTMPTEQETTPTEQETTPTEQETTGASQGNAEAGKAIYAEQGCGGCHVFEPAGSSGTVGPNLDDSDVDFEGAVEQIRNGGGGMPAFGDKLNDQQIADVAAFVTQGR